MLAKPLVASAGFLESMGLLAYMYVYEYNAAW